MPLLMARQLSILFKFYSKLTSMEGRHGAQSLKKQKLHPGTFLDTVLARRLGHKAGPSM